VTRLALGRRLGFALLGGLVISGLVATGLSRRSAIPAAELQGLLAQATPAQLWAWWALATRDVLAVSGAATLSGVLLGSTLGALAVYGPGGFGGVLRRLLGFTGTVPALLLVGMLRLGDPTRGLLSLLIALSLLRALEVAQLVRAEVLSTLLSDFVEASRALGGSRRWQLRWHVLPRVARPLLVNSLQGAASLIGLEAALSFAELGLPNNLPSWGGGLAVLGRHGSAAGLGLAVLSIGLTSATLYGLGLSFAEVPRPALAPRDAPPGSGKPLGAAPAES
jgi:ABC-type dipeptide/oligopeptide/nickel transport system permease subunit